MKLGEKWKKFKNLPFICMLFNGTFSATGSVLSIGFVLLVLALMFMSSASVELGEESLEANAMLIQKTEIAYEDIREVKLIDMDEHVMGERASGFTNLFSVSGSYYNDEYVIYDVYFSKRNTENCVAVRYTEYDAYLLFNVKDPAQTESMYYELLELTENNN